MIARSMSLSNGSVNSYLQRARIAGLRWPLPVDLDDGALERPLFPPAATAQAARARPRSGWADVDKEMRRKGVTLALLREEYRAAHPDGFGRSAPAKSRMFYWKFSNRKISAQSAATVRFHSLSLPKGAMVLTCSRARSSAGKMMPMKLIGTFSAPPGSSPVRGSRW